MMPHMPLAPFLLLVGDPALDVSLLPGAHGERTRGNVLANRRAAADVGAFTDGDGRDELRIAADERAVLDRRLILLLAVVVARDRAGADVHLVADRRVAEIRKMPGFRSGAEHRLLKLDEVPDVRPLADVGAVAEVREGAEARGVGDTRVHDQAVVEDDDAIADLGIDDARAAVN